MHGVGDPIPGDTLSLFARSLADPHQPLQETVQTVWLSEKSNDTDHVQTFPAHQRKLQFENQNIELCEAFWGDLSRVRRGWIGVIRGIFQILFGLRYVAYVGADQPGPAAYWLKRLGLVSSKILHGPVLAVTFFLTLLVIAVCGTQLLWPDSYKAPIWTQVVLLSCSGFAICAAEIGNRLTRSRVVERFWFWVNVTTMFVTGLLLLKLFYLDNHFSHAFHDCPAHPGLLGYCRILLVLLGMLWFLEIQVIVSMAICWFVAITHPRSYRPALHVAFLLPALAVGIWGQMLPLLWVSAKEGVDRVAGVPEFAKVFDDALPFLGVQLLMMVIIGVATSIVLARYFLWRKKITKAKFQAGHRGPRLIVNTSLQLVLAFCTAVGVAIVSVLCVLQFAEQSYTDYWLGRLMADVNRYAVSVLVPMGGLIVLLVPRLRPAFDMMLDVVNHFYFRSTNVQDALDDDDEFDIAETTFENGTLFFSRRDNLHQRLKRILFHYRDQFEHQPELIIISHSQGTMVAIEVLNDEEVAWINNSFKSVTLVTMGCPLQHMYQHYFGHCYPQLDQPYWSSLRRRIDRWVNICRVDDFVGVDLSFPESQPVIDPSILDGDRPFFSPTHYSNHAVGPRGHTSYWSDREVLQILSRHLFDHECQHEESRTKAA